MYQCYSGYYDGGTLCGNFDATFSTDAMTYWERSFFQRLRGLIEFNGLPESGPGQVG